MHVENVLHIITTNSHLNMVTKISKLLVYRLEQGERSRKMFVHSSQKFDLNDRELISICQYILIDSKK